MKPTHAVFSFTCLLAFATHAQFDAARNGPWTVVDLSTMDPRGFVVSNGQTWVWGKTPLDGPPMGGVVRSLGNDATVALPEDPSVLLDEGGRWLIGTKGVAGQKRGRVLQVEGGVVSELPGGAFDAEVTALLRHEGALYVGTQLDGVWRLSDGARARVGVKTTVLPQGYQWTQRSASNADVELVVPSPTGLVVLSKDFQVRLLTNDGEVLLGNVAEAVVDAAGLVTSALREPKGLAVLADGSIVVGTKGREGSPEGKDLGAVFRWNGTAWTSLTTGQTFRKEVKALVEVDGALFAGTNESGVWRLVGGAWTTFSEGLPVEPGNKVKGSELQRGASGSLYVPVKNALYRRATTDARWVEAGFFPNGEEIKAVLEGADGALVVGCKVGTNQGAVYRQHGTGWTQVGVDLPLEVKRLVQGPDGRLYAVLGGVGGAWRFDGTTWENLSQSLSGNASQVKDLLVRPDGSFIAGTKQGVWEGVFRQAPVTLLASGLDGAEVVGLVSHGGGLLVVSKLGGVFRLGAGAGDDGLAWTRVTPEAQRFEVQGVTSVGGSNWLLGKRLLYRLAGEGGAVSVEAIGSNPGRPVRDGDGALAFTGETEFLALAQDHEGRLFAATKDGLFVASAPGAEWAFFNGPGEVKAVSITGSTLTAAVKVKDELAGTSSAAAWQVDVSAAPQAPAPAPARGCTSTTGLEAGLVALLLGLTRRRR
jgi:hypothetical protein